MKDKQKPLVICITGKMGSGKSTVARMFREHFGIPVYNADERAKALMHGERLKKEIISVFGEKSFKNDVLNRQWLAEKVFHDEELLKKLEAIVHPAVYEDFLRWKEAHHEKNYVILENAILFKSGMDRFCDWIIYVRAGDKTLIERIKQRDGLSERQIKARWRHQPLNVNKIKKRVLFIDNDNTLDDLLIKIKKIYLKIDDN